MKYPEFFDKVEKIKLYDPLAEFLGSFENGVIEYSFVEIVKMAGHGCLTVAGAYLATLHGLKALFADTLPERGKIKVEFPMGGNEGTQGVIANVVSNITGATYDWGFKGIGGEFSRVGLMFFNAEIDCFAKFTRTDTGESVSVYYNPGKAVQPGNLVMQMFQNRNNEQEFKPLLKKWLETVQTVLENGDKVIEVKKG